jgi:hypothetical protein
LPKTLSPAGRDVWERFTREHAAEVNAVDFPEHLRGPWSKMRAYQGRLALILHLLRSACGDAQVTRDAPVDGDSMERAVVMVRYFKSHLRKVYAAMGADNAVEDARRVLRWVEREDRTEFKRWELHTDIRNQGRFPRVEDLDQPLARLV